MLTMTLSGSSETVSLTSLASISPSRPRRGRNARVVTNSGLKWRRWYIACSSLRARTSFPRQWLGSPEDVLVKTKRNKAAAPKLMRKLLKKYGFLPEELVTDDL